MGILHYCFYTYYRIFSKNNYTAQNLERFAYYKDQSLLKNKIKDKEVWWFNCASAGEFNTIKKLLIEVDRPDRFIVITTSTNSGVIAFNNHKHISDNIIHLYVPYDTPQAISKFLNFWKPSKIILVESEIWPNIILQGSRFSKIHIINARLSKRSFDRWSMLSWLFKYILSYVSSISASSQTDFNYYKKFYKDVVLTGNLKYDADPLSYNPVDLQQIQSSIGDRQVFICASTHPGEEEILISVYKRLLELIPDLILILIPRNQYKVSGLRHIERGETLLDLAFSHKLIAILRSKDSNIHNHIPTDTNVYIINTIGDLGIAFRLGKIVFMGGSIVDIGGHNCCEPAMLECGIITGKNMTNFIDLMEGMVEASAVIIASTEDEIFESAKRLFDNPEEVMKLGANAKRFVQSNSGALDRTIAVINGFQN